MVTATPPAFLTVAAPQSTPSSKIVLGIPGVSGVPARHLPRTADSRLSSQIQAHHTENTTYRTLLGQPAGRSGESRRTAGTKRYMSLPKGDICPCSKEVYVLDPKTYMSLDERHICPWTKGVYLLERGGYTPLVESSGGFSRPFRRLFRNACGAAWISRRQVPSPRARALYYIGAPRDTRDTRDHQMWKRPCGCPGGLGRERQKTGGQAISRRSTVAPSGSSAGNRKTLDQG